MLSNEGSGAASGLTIVGLVAREAISHKWKLVLGFVVICAAGAGVGMFWPESYSSSMTVYVEQQNIIDPLMEGRAERTNVSDWAQNAREVVYNRSLLTEAARRTGRIGPDASASEKEEALKALRDATAVSNPGQSLIRIEYRGGDPKSVYETTETLGNLLIEQMLEMKERESRAAFEFIDQQVKKYETELQHTQQELKKIREQHPVAQEGAFEELSTRQVQLRDQIDDLEQQLREARIRAESLEQQLSGEADTSTVVTREDELEQRIAELREELETLRLSYQESYPDIVQLKQQIASLQAELETVRQGAPDGGSPTSAARTNPVYQQLQSDLYDTRTQIRTLEARLAAQREKLATTREQAALAQDVRSEIEKLQRDYAVNQDIYEDLLRRRENARVSKNLDTEQQGLTIRVQEEAYMPHTPAGPRMLHFALGGGVLGIAAPLGLLFGVVSLDPRIRLVTQLPPVAQASLVAKVPHALGRRRLRRERWSTVLAVLAMLLAVVLLGVLMWLKTTGKLAI